MMRTMLMIALGALASAAQAADPGAGDAARGKNKAAVCAACHGAGGNSSNPEWPKLGGQHASYVAGQLEAFKSGARKDPVMSGQATGLSAADIADLAAYYAAQPATPGVANPDAVAAAEKLYRGGRAADGIPACTACHGPAGRGNGPAAYPLLSGQHAVYAAKQLRAYRGGERLGTDSGRMMSKVAEKLTDADIEALASYLSGLH